MKRFRPADAAASFIKIFKKALTTFYLCSRESDNPRVWQSIMITQFRESIRALVGLDGPQEECVGA